jgi:hypothetical protein
MGRRQEYLDRERTAWVAFDDSLAQGRASFGWPPGGVAAHVAFWMRRAADALEAISRGDYDPTAFAIDVDAENDRRLPEWGTADLDDARADLAQVRDRLLRAWSSIDDPDEEAAGWFEGDTFEHYEEHLAGAEDLGASDGS